jgi:Holliday junction resolvasome RuvABC endonuclease subunit
MTTLPLPLPPPPSSVAAPRVAGLDPSLTSFGLTVVSGPDLRPCCYRLRPKTRGHERLAYLLAEVDRLTAGCDLAVIEGVAFAATGSTLLDLAGLGWMVRHQLWEAGIPYVMVAPSTRAKYITGNGSAGKDECLAAVIKRLGHLADVTGNDVADALTLAAMGSDWAGFPLAAMPALQRAVLTSVHQDKKRRGQPVIAWPAR